MPESPELETLVGSLEAKELALTNFDGKTTIIPIQPFNTFKTAHVLKMLADVRTKIDLVQLLSEMAQMTTADTLIRCPHCKVTMDTRGATIIDPAETDPQKIRIGCENCKNPFYVKDALSASDESNTRKVSAALSAIPTLIAVAPDLLLDFSALAIISNKELAEVYDEPNGIAKKIKEKRKMLELEHRPDAPLKILRAFLPHLGIDFLVSELGQMDKAIASILNPLTSPKKNPLVG